MQSKKEAFRDISAVVDHSRQRVKFHRAAVASEDKFIEQLADIIAKEAPEFKEKFNEIRQSFTKVTDLEKAIVSAEERSAEDINDLQARYEVIFRISEEHNLAKRKLNDTRQKIEKLRRDLDMDEMKGGTRKYRIEGDINRAIDAKKQAIDAAEEKVLELIDAKEKYSTFKINRLQHAFQHLGKEVSDKMNELSNAAHDLQNLLNDTLENVDNILVESGQPTDETGSQE